ncbi:MAG: diacylglycerol kinase family protein [Nitrososphaeraceae archaeon]
MKQLERTSTETALVVNPNSCGGLTGKNWESLYSEIKGIFSENPLVVFSQKPRHGTTLTRDLLRKGFKKIIALGGDGTINEVVNGFFEELTGSNQTATHVLDTHMLGKHNHGERIETSSGLKPINSDAMMGVVPAGSRNVLAKSLDLPDGIVECCQRFVNGKPQKIDVISALVTRRAVPPGTNTNEHPNEVITRIFLNAAEIGVAAEIIDRSKRIRDKVKSRFISTISSVIATLPTYESNLCEVSIDDGVQSLLLKMTMGVIANGSHLGGGFKTAPQASMSDGLLDITILKSSGSFKMLEGLADMRGDSNQPVENNDIFYTQGKKVSIKSKERDITVTVDGEPIGVLPGIFQMYQNALTLKF